MQDTVIKLIHFRMYSVLIGHFSFSSVFPAICVLEAYILIQQCRNTETSVKRWNRLISIVVFLVRNMSLHFSSHCVSK